MVLSLKKSVHFALNDSTICKYDRTSLSSSRFGSPETMFYQPSEYEQIRREALESVQEAKQRGMSAYLQQNYGCTDSKTQEMLNIWAKRKNTNRGLERFVCEEYGQQRLLHRKKIIEAVLYAQDKLRKDHRHGASGASIIQTVSSTLSVNAIQFARMLAIADRAAVGRSEMTVHRRVPTPSVSRPSARPPTGKSPIVTRKHRHDTTSSTSQRPPRHPGPVRYQIRVSPLA